MLLDPEVERYLRKQDAHIQLMLRSKLRKLHDPLNHIDSYHGAYYKFRLGGYRALLTLDFTGKIVFVHELDKRSRVYD